MKMISHLRMATAGVGGDINIHIDINVNIDSHIIIDMNFQYIYIYCIAGTIVLNM